MCDVGLAWAYCARHTCLEGRSLCRRESNEPPFLLLSAFTPKLLIDGECNMQRPCCRIVLGLTLLLGTLQAAAQDPRQEFEVHSDGLLDISLFYEVTVSILRTGCYKRIHKLLLADSQVVFWASSLSPATQASILSCPYNVSILGVGRDWPYNGIKLKLTFEYIRYILSTSGRPCRKVCKLQRQGNLSCVSLNLNLNYLVDAPELEDWVI